MTKKNLIIVTLVIIVSIIGLSLPRKDKASGNMFKGIVISYKKYKSITFDFSYKQKNPDAKLENLVLPGETTKYGAVGYIGKFSRGLRFKDITDAVEDRYNLPRGIIFGMMIEESSGMDLLPNALGDGGFGLCHMQASTASEFGMKIYKNCHSLICNGKDRRSCKTNGRLLNHAKDLSDFIQENKNDRVALLGADDRLHIIKNLDAVGRMLASHMDGPQINGIGPLRTAIYRYAGETNYKQYWRDVRHNMSLLEDPKFIASVEKKFNELNQNLLIDGKKGNWQSYLKVFNKMNDNYGLTEYKLLPKYTPKNSQLVKATYKNFL